MDGKLRQLIFLMLIKLFGNNATNLELKFVGLDERPSK